jgi:hypothetical protein
MAASSADGCSEAMRAANDRARSIVKELLSSESDCGAVVLDSRRAQESIDSGASKTSSIGIRNVRFWIR